MNTSRTPRAVVQRLSLFVETLCGESSSRAAHVHSKAAPSVAKRTKTGLFAGRRILSGNNVSEDGGNRTRRTWKPNAQSAALYSELLDKTVRVNVTPAALRSIDKAGGLDAYVLHSKDAADNALRKQLVEAARKAS
mmetsp:Transcript_1162/g.3689  ORF Transcript_1162/g.3689 Transcript_1162/m.3689 type:complete len:136 (+) Transcript_1162:62-469(+)